MPVDFIDLGPDLVLQLQLQTACQPPLILSQYIEDTSIRGNDLGDGNSSSSLSLKAFGSAWR
jgi:hypothetical protein